MCSVLQVRGREIERAFLMEEEKNLSLSDGARQRLWKRRQSFFMETGGGGSKIRM